MRPDDLRGAARDAYDMWRNTFGLSEQRAMRALEQDGLITLTEDEKFARSLQETWGLSRAAAEIAARGRDGGSRAASAGVSVAELAVLRPDPAYIPDVIRAIERVATDLCRRGVSEDKALQEATFGLMRRMPNDALADWVLRIAAIKWPHLYNTSGAASPLGSTSSKSVRG
jgi:hypothetical protein